MLSFLVHVSQLRRKTDDHRSNGKPPISRPVRPVITQRKTFLPRLAYDRLPKFNFGNKIVRNRVALAVGDSGVQHQVVAIVGDFREDGVSDSGKDGVSHSREDGVSNPESLVS